jgi:hypothetical protein
MHGERILWQKMNDQKLDEWLSRKWDTDIVPRLIDYIRIPCKSPHFDPQWAANGHLDSAISLAESWARAQAIAGLQVEIIRLPHVRSPRQAAGDDRLA